MACNLQVSFKQFETDASKTAFPPNRKTHQLEEPDVVPAAERHEGVEGRPDLGGLPDPVLQGEDGAEDVAVVQVHEDLVGAELGLGRAGGAVELAQVLVHVLEGLQAPPWGKGRRKMVRIRTNKKTNNLEKKIN